MAAFNVLINKGEKQKVHSVWMEIKGNDEEIAEAQRDKVREEKGVGKEIYDDLFKFIQTLMNLYSIYSTFQFFVQFEGSQVLL